MSLKKFVLLFMMKPVACSSLNNEGGGWSPKVIMGHQGFICGCFATNQGLWLFSYESGSVVDPP